MSLKRNKSGGALDVPLLDRVVEDGETVEVPDFQPAHNPDSAPGDPDYLAIVWPGDKWEDADPPKPAAKASAAAAARADTAPVITSGKADG